MEKKRTKDLENLEKRYPDSNVDCPNDDSVTDGDEGDKTTPQPSKEKRSKSKRTNVA